MVESSQSPPGSLPATPASIQQGNALSATMSSWRVAQASLISQSRAAPPSPKGRGLEDGYTLTDTAKSVGHAQQAEAPPICVLDGLTGELLCCVPARQATDGRSLKAAVQSSCGIPKASQRLLWGGQGLPDGHLPSDLVRGGVRDVRLVRVEAPSWNVALDRCAATTDAGLIPPDLRDDLWPTGGFATSPEDYTLLHQRSFALALVVQDGCALRLVHQSLQAEKQVVLAAVRESGLALVWASEDLKQDREVVMTALGQDGRALEFASHELRADPDVVLAAVEQHGEALQYAMGEWCSLDRTLALAAVRRNSTALKLAHFALLKERDFCLDAVKVNGDALHYVPDCFRGDKEFVLAAKAFWADKESYQTSALLPERAKEFVEGAGFRAAEENQQN